MSASEARHRRGSPLRYARAFALAVVLGPLLAQACGGGAECLRDTDCAPAFECRAGACTVRTADPPPDGGNAGAAGSAGSAGSAGAPNDAMPDASDDARPNDSGHDARDDAGETGAGGEGGGAGAAGASP